MGVDSGDSAPLRRGSRVKRPAARYVTEAEERSRARPTTRKRATDSSVDEEQAKRLKSAGNDESDEDDDGEYCVCRTGNDGTPMICCSQCDEWFHFKCIGLSKRAAERLDEYVCEACQAQKRTKDDDDEYEAKQDEAEQDEAEQNEAEQEDDPDEFEGHHSDASSSSEKLRPRAAPKRARPKPTKRPRTGVDDNPVRRHVLSTFTAIFTPLFTAKNLAPEAAASYAEELEQELFHALGTEPSLRAYKERFRTLHFNLKDTRNVSLHERITSGQLPAKDVVHLSNEALANDTIRQATEKAKRDALEQAVLLREKEEGPARKITHKGEVDIERDDAAFAPKDSQPAAAPESVPASLPDAAEMPSSPPFTPAKEARAVSPLPESDTFTGLWDQHEAPIPDEAPMDEPAMDLGLDAPAEADSFVDSFLGDERPSSSTSRAAPEPSEAPAADAPSDTRESHTPPGTPPPDSFAARWAARSQNALYGSPVVWDGVITMPEYTSAYVHVRPLTRPWYAPEAPLWRDCFPTPERTVEGRLPSQTAIDYLAQVRLSPRNEIVVLALDAGGASAASERHQGPSTLHSSPALDKLVRYFSDKQRFGVLAPAPGIQGSLVKDFYLAPLLSHEPVPEWLTMLHPDGLGDTWSKERPAHMLFVILVLFKAAMEGKTAAPPPPRAAPEAQAAVPPAASVSLDTLLNVKPDAIQNLLSTLKGGGASPLSAAGTPPPLAGSAPGPGAPPGPAPLLPMGGLPPSGLPPPPPPPVPVARPMRPWGGVVRTAQPPPSFPPPMTAPGPPLPFSVGPGGWYGGNAERSNDRARRRGGGAKRSPR